MPSRDTTIDVLTDGEQRRPLRRRSAFIATGCPRRQKPSAVNSAVASASLQTRGHRVGAVAGEQRQDDAADLDDREEGDDQLGAHRHEERDPVARADAERAQRVRAAIDLAPAAPRR